MYSISLVSCIGYIAGVLLGGIDFGSVVIFLISFLAIVLIRFKKFNIHLVLCVIMLCTGNLRYNACMDKDSVLSDYADEYAYVTATVCDIPKDYGDTYRYTVKTQNFRFETADIPYKARMNITSEEKYNFGDTVEFYGVLRAYEDNLNKYSFDTTSYYNSNGIFYKMYAKETVYVGKEESFGIAGIRNKMYEIISQNESDDIRDMIADIYLGISGDADSELYELLDSAGTGRYLNSARIHYLIIIAAIALLRTRISRRSRDVITVLLLILYCMINPSSGSAYRITAFAVVMIAFVYIRGFNTFLDAASVAILAVGLINPLMLKSGGFLLSVSTAVAMHIFYEPVCNCISKLIKIRAISRIITVYIILMIVMIPFSAYLGFKMSLYSILVMPLFLFIITVFWVLAPLYFIIPSVIGIVLEGLCGVIVVISLVIKALPLSSFTLPRPTVEFLVMWYSFMLALRYKSARIKLFTVCGVVSLIFVVGEIRRLNDFEVHFVSVGQGDGAVVSVPYKQNILVDGGGLDVVSGYDNGKQQFLPYLTGNGFGRIDAAFVSHYHEDHAIGVIHAVKMLKVDTLYLPYESEDNEIYCALVEAAKSAGTKVEILSDKDKINLGDITVDVIIADKDAKDENERSAVYRFNYGEFQMLFTGDIGESSEGKIVSGDYDISCDVVKVPHHGSKYSSTTEFLKETSASLALVGTGRNNVYGFPTPEALGRYEEVKIPVFSTSQRGNMKIIAESDGKFKLYDN